MNHNLFSKLAAVLAGLFLTIPCSAWESNDKKETGVTSPTAKGPSKSMYPFRGTIASVDVKAATVGIARQEGGDRILRISAETALSRDGTDIALENLKAGDYLRGRLERQPNGDEVIIKANAGTKPEKSEEEDRPKRKKKDSTK